MDELKQRSLRGARVALLPYTRAYVAQYHAHMQDEELRTLTASEPMSLEGEHELWATLAADVHALRLILVTLGAPHDMVGDVNVHVDADDRTVAEVDVMVASRPHRRQGFAREALLLLLPECERALGIGTWLARIKTYNAVRGVRFYAHASALTCVLFRLPLPCLRAWGLLRTADRMCSKR